MIVDEQHRMHHLSPGFSGSVIVRPSPGELLQTASLPLSSATRCDSEKGFLDMDIRTVGDLGELPSSLPIFALPQVPLTFETLQIIFPYSVGLAAVGLLESLLTAQIVDDMCIRRHRGHVMQSLDILDHRCALLFELFVSVE